MIINTCECFLRFYVWEQWVALLRNTNGWKRFEDIPTKFHKDRTIFQIGRTTQMELQHFIFNGRYGMCIHKS